MSDKLEWIKEHAVLLKDAKVANIAANDGYKAPDDLASIDNSQGLLNAFREQKRHKEGADFLAHALHKRAAIWWVYGCAVMGFGDRIEAVASNTAEDGKPKKRPKVTDAINNPEPYQPQWLKDAMGKMKENIAKSEAQAKEDLAKIQKELELAQARHAQIESQIDPALLKEFKDGVEQAYREIQSEFGVYLPDLQNKIIEQLKNPKIDTGPTELDKEIAALKEKLTKIEGEIDEDMSVFFPDSDSAKLIAKTTAAMDAVYAWVASPDETNASVCMDASKGIEAQPEGLLAQSAFWAAGNLNPGGEVFVKAPPELVANGLKGTLIQLAVIKSSDENGEKMSAKKWYERFFELGLKVAYGLDNWEESLKNDLAPHRQIDSLIALPDGRFASHLATNVPQNDFNATSDSANERFK